VSQAQSFGDVGSMSGLPPESGPQHLIVPCRMSAMSDAVAVFVALDGQLSFSSAALQ